VLNTVLNTVQPFFLATVSVSKMIYFWFHGVSNTDTIPLHTLIALLH